MDARARRPPGYRVAIAGAAGFVGRSLAAALRADHHVVGLTRVPHQAPPDTVDEWRACDLLALHHADEALRGVDVAYYLVHSMMPSARLTQGGFWDFDLIVADNFARAAERAGVQQIIYLGGIVPSRDVLSRHLRSRHEVEQVLRDRAVPVTVLRAGLVIGGGGSSFLAMARVVERLPFLVCPPWSRTLSHPIALADVVTLLRFCLANPRTSGETFDIGGPELMSYETMMRVIAKALGVRRRRVRIGVGNTAVLQRCVSLITGAPRELIEPLIESLKYPIVARERRLNRIAGLHGTPFTVAVREAIRTLKDSDADEPRRPIAFQRARAGSGTSSVRSVQRFVRPHGWTAEMVARRYLLWLPGALRWLVRVDVERDEVFRISLRFPRRPLLVLRRSVERSWSDRWLFHITGGLLAGAGPAQRLEFREALARRHIIAAVHDYRPRLPWYVYRLTQARLHLWVMRTFATYLRSIAGAHGAVSRSSGAGDR